MMISYAQNFEDVILERIFKDKKTGTYVDIGACHPVYDSVTQHFYLRGWSGINIEPQPKLFAELQAVRQRDINLDLCVGAQPGQQTLYITRNVGTSTLNPALAEQYRQSQEIDQEITVELITLNQLWSEKLQDRHVDFMKIDVEGFEREVLAGADFSLVSPSILVIEATRPNSSELCHHQWEMLVLEHYEFFYFDGLNRFYSRKGSSIDTTSAGIPPNVFDHFKTYPQFLLEQANTALTQEKDALSKQLQNCLTLLTDKDVALDDAGSAYAELQTEDESLHEQLQSTYRELATFRSERDKAQQAFQALQAAFESKEQDLCKALDMLQTKEEALNDAAQAYQHLESALETKDQQLRDMIEQLRPKDSALAESGEAYRVLQDHLLQKTDEIRNLQKHLLDNEQALQHASHAYETLQKELHGKKAELANLQTHLMDKEQALQVASLAYGALQETLSLDQQELASVRKQQDACSSSLYEATTAYEALQKELNRKETDLVDLQKYLQEKDIAILDATRSYETLQKALQEKDFALAHSAQAYKDLKDDFDEKLRELGELHASLSPPTQPKVP